MHKLFRVFNVEEENNEIKSADYEIIHEFDEFDYTDKTKDMLLAICKAKKLEYSNPYNDYTIVEYKDDRPVAIVGQLFYHSDNDELESWMGFAEFNERVVASVALGVDLVLSEETKKKYGYVTS